MKQFFCFVWCFLIFSFAHAQETNSLYKSKKIITDSLTTTVHLDSVALNNTYFKIANNQGIDLDTANYTVDYNKATLTFTKPLQDTLNVSFLNYPDFLTRTYA